MREASCGNYETVNVTVVFNSCQTIVSVFNTSVHYLRCLLNIDTLHYIRIRPYTESNSYYQH